jgi:hypothetical protein
MSKVTYPQNLKFHKKVAQLQIDLFKARDEETSAGKITSKEGAVFFAIAKSLGPDTDRMDWDNKITMKISPTDISKIVVGCRKRSFPVDLIHRSEKTGRTTTLKIEPGQREGTYRWTIAANYGKDDNRNQFVSIYLSDEDMFLVFNVLEASVPLILGWSS